MALKTFNIEPIIYEEFSQFCKKEGISMSKKVENFIKSEIEKIKLQNEKDKSPKLRSLSNHIEPNNLEHPLKKYC